MGSYSEKIPVKRRYTLRKEPKNPLKNIKNKKILLLVIQMKAKKIESLDSSKVTGNKKIWKNIQPIFSEKRLKRLHL